MPYVLDHEKTYPTDLIDAEWECLVSHLPAPNERGRPRGRPRTHAAREILDAVFYVLKSGCTWRMLPHDFPLWETVLRLVQAMAHRRGLGEDEPGLARAGADKVGEEPAPQRGRGGLPIREDHWGRRRSTGRT